MSKANNFCFKNLRLLEYADGIIIKLLLLVLEEKKSIVTVEASSTCGSKIMCVFLEK